MTKVCILDYGSGNVASVFNLISYLGYDCKISNKVDYIEDSSHIILPGVGSYSKSIEKIKKNISIEFLEKQILEKKKPFLGICVGMQILSTIGQEFEVCNGLNWINGTVKKMDNDKLPHIGWNNVKIKKDSDLFKNLSNEEDFYFLHSYHFLPENQNVIVAETNYETFFCSVIECDNIFGVQFHPEKSQKAGQILIKNFLDFNL